MITLPEPNPNSTVPGGKLWGWMGEDELQWLYNQSQTMQSVVEIGSLLGRSAMALLTGCRGPVYCIDPWDDPDNYGYSAFISNVGCFPNLIAIRGFSPAAGSRIHGNIDMVFIDGNHDYENCKADIEYWFPRTNKLICGHDYTHTSYPGVARSVNEFFEKRRLLVEVAPGTSIWNVRIT